MISQPPTNTKTNLHTLPPTNANPGTRAAQSIGGCLGRLVALTVIICVPIAVLILALRLVRDTPTLIDHLAALPAHLQHGLCMILAATLHALITRPRKPSIRK